MSRFRFFLGTFLLPLSMVAALETWTDPNGRTVEAKLVGAKGGYVILEKADGSRLVFPASRLRPEEQARLPEGALVAAVEARSGGGAASAGASLTRIAAELDRKLVRLQADRLVPVSRRDLAATQVYALYFSASWCPPCRRFSRDLVRAYQEIKPKHPEFEVILVSADRNEVAMRDYMRDYEMPWLALTFQATDNNPTVAPYRQSGIPNLVFIDGSGRVLARSYDDRGLYLGPQRVLRTIYEHFGL